MTIRALAKKVIRPSHSIGQFQAAFAELPSRRQRRGVFDVALRSQAADAGTKMPVSALLSIEQASENDVAVVIGKGKPIDSAVGGDQSRGASKIGRAHV